MGGYGSGPPEKYRGTVEACCSLDIREMLRQKWIEPGRRTSGIIKWLFAGKEVASIGFEAKMDIRPPYLRLCYTWNQTDHIDYKVYCTTSSPYFGGVRFWFLCSSCGKRVGKLYLAYGQRYFACRICEQLTYRSCRESHDDDAIIAKIRQPGQSRSEAMRSLKELRESLWASCGYSLKK